MKNLVALLQKKAARIPDARAFLFLENGETESGSLTYKELEIKARAIAAYLQEKNLFSKQVLLLYPPGLDFISAFLGCLYAGVIAVPINCPKPNEFEKSKALIKTLAHEVNASDILTTSSYAQLAAKELSGEKIEIINTAIIEEEFSRKFIPVRLQLDSVAYLQFSSGSTAAPKASIISHRNLIHNIKQSAKAWHYQKTSITLTWAPHSHVYGLVCGLLVPLCYGGLTILLRAESIIINPLTWLKAISKYKVTHSGCPNFAYELCNKTINEDAIKTLDLTHWKVAVNGGENVNAETLTHFAEKFSQAGFSIKNFCPAYGMSELAGTIASNRYLEAPHILKLNSEGLRNNKIIIAKADEAARTLISYGKCIPGTHAIIVNPITLMKAKEDEIGEIWLSGNTLASGYWQRKAETEEQFNAKLINSKKHYFRTGDLGFIKNGQIFIAGRLKEVIVIYGKKYYPADLEMTIALALEKYQMHGSRAVISTVIDEKEEILVIQEINLKQIASADTIIENIRAKISEVHGIDLHGVILVKENSLPKTISGKLQRKLCKQFYVENKLEILKKTVKETHYSSSNHTVKDYNNSYK